MNYHSDEWIMDRLKEHYNEALEYFPEDRIVGVFYQGSGNYGLDYEGSDVDTKLIVTPTLDDIIFVRKPVSTTHVRDNDEHIDFKDIRLMFQTFRKCNLNFTEILFTKYKVVNPLYKEQFAQFLRETLKKLDNENN
jgi:predicted nucleotidyltransferase